MKDLHILITYANTGSGHKMPAMAIAESIENLYPNRFQITTSNFFEDAGEIKFDKYIEKSWDFLLKNRIAMKCVSLIGNIFSRIAPYWIRVFHHRVWKNSIQYMKKINPDIIFSTHFFTQTVAIDAKKKFGLKYSIITLNPDTFEVYPQWDRRGDLLLVCSDHAEKKALRMGHAPNKVKKVPNPMRKQFDIASQYDKQKLQQEYNIRSGVFTILMSDGGQGVGQMYASIKMILHLKIPLNIIAVCGKNQKLYTKLKRLSHKLSQKNHPVQLIVFGFTASISPLIAISDVFIGKSGPNSILECLKMTLPVIINFSNNPAERTVAINYTKMGVAWRCRTRIQLYFLLRKLIHHPIYLHKIRKKIETLDCFDNGNEIIAKIIVETLEQH